MNWFTLNVAPHLIYVMIAALLVGLAGAYYARRYRAKPARFLFRGVLVLELLLVASFAALSVHTQHSDHFLMLGVWILLAFMTFRQLSRFA